MKHLLRSIGNAAWLRLGLRRRIVGTLYPAASSPSYPFTVDYHGFKYRGDIAVAQEWHVFFFGGYELKEAALMGDVLRAIPGATAFDIGANLGGHTLLMACHAEEVHAFEPLERLAMLIEQRVGSNLGTKVHVHRFGLGEQDEEKAYFLDEASHNSGTGSFIAEHANAPQVATLPLRRGDDWAANRKVDFIKIDVEGYEAPALMGLRQTLVANHPIVMMEVTESSWKVFESFGGLAAVLPYEFDIYEICNPPYLLGFVQFHSYRLERRAVVQPRKASFNLLLVPRSRRAVVDVLGKA